MEGRHVALLSFWDAFGSRTQLLITTLLAAPNTGPEGTCASVTSLQPQTWPIRIATVASGHDSPGIHPSSQQQERPSGRSCSRSVVVQPLFYSICTAPGLARHDTAPPHASFLTSPVTASSICLSDRPSSDCCFSLPNSAPGLARVARIVAGAAAGTDGP